MKELIAFAVVALLTASVGALAFAGSAAPAAACAAVTAHGTCGN
jgi:hypothetical protein